MIALNDRQVLIQNMPCFAHFSQQESLELAQLMDEIECQAGDEITREGELIDSFYLIESGEAEVTRKESTQCIAILHPGDPIGLNASGFFSETGIRTATVTAYSPMVLLRLSLDVFDHYLLNHERLQGAMAQSVKQMLKMQLIKSAAPFTALSSERIHWLADRIEERDLPPNEIIFNEGDEGESCYLIRSGRVQIFMTDPAGHKRILATLQKPALFGEIALLASTPRNASAITLENCHVLVLHKSDFIELMSQEESAVNAVTALALERARPVVNKNVLVSQHLTADGETIMTLKNPEQNTYYQLSHQGWFIYQHLNGQNTLQDLTTEFNHIFNVFLPDFIYQIVVDLIAGGFVEYTNHPTKVVE